MNSIEKQLTAFANTNLKKWGLYQQGWRFEFNRRARRRLGNCIYDPKKIELSSYVLGRISESDCCDVILHEIAHALTPVWDRYGKRNGHGSAWKRNCVKVGANPSRLYTKPIPNKDFSWLLVCPNCEKEHGYYRKPKMNLRACHTCCTAHNKGKHDMRFVLYLKRA